MPEDTLFPEMAPKPKPRPRIGRPGDVAPVSLAVLEAQKPVPQRRIEVTRQDIAGAKPSAPHCPTAWAIRREYRLDPSVKVFVWKGHIQIGETVYAMPIEQSRREFDYNILGTMEPHFFTFDDQTPIDTI